MNRREMRTGFVTMAVVACLLCCGTATAKKPPKPPPEEPTAAYTLVDLLALPGGDWLQSSARSISQPDAMGRVFVAGNSYVGGQQHPVLWDVGADGSFDPSVYPLDLDAPAHLSFYVVNTPEVSVNTAGVVVERKLGYVFQPFVQGLETQDLSTEDFEAAPTAINNGDEIAGWIVYDDGTTRWGSGALWMLDAGIPAAPIPLVDFTPYDISETGLMAGRQGATAVVAKLDENGLQVTSLGVLPGYDFSKANAISSDGVWVAGSCKKIGVNEQGLTFLIGKEAFVWSETSGMIGLGRLGDPASEALGVNVHGQVVGYSDTNGRYPEAAFLWQPGSLDPQDGQMLDLNALADTGKIHLYWARDINDAGQIVGVMRLTRPVSEDHGFVLIPTPSGQ